MSQTPLAKTPSALARATTRRQCSAKRAGLFSNARYFSTMARPAFGENAPGNAHGGSGIQRPPSQSGASSKAR